MLNRLVYRRNEEMKYISFYKPVRRTNDGQLIVPADEPWKADKSEFNLEIMVEVATPEGQATAKIVGWMAQTVGVKQ